jgi:hypothetical protein
MKMVHHEKSLTINSTDPCHENILPRNCVAPCIELTGKETGILLSVFSINLHVSSITFTWHGTPQKTTCSNDQEWFLLAHAKIIFFLQRLLTHLLWITDLLPSFLTFGNDIFIVVSIQI